MTTATMPVSTPAKTRRVFNFCAGPGALPDSVLRQMQQDVWDIGGSGVGICEHSHRGKVFDRVLEEAEGALRQVGSVPANYRILFLTGGASTQNFMVPANLLARGGTADYLETGYWAQKSIQEAKFYGTVHVACSSKDKGFSYIPSAQETRYSASPAYVHFTSNNTIYGTEFHREPVPPPGVPLVCDMSSDIFSRPVDVSKYALIYAGAQKNLGIAGTTIVIIRDDLVERGSTELPTMLQYRTHAKEQSRYNTPPVFAIYVTGLVAKWILAQGGLQAVGAANAAKAKVIYDVLDASKFYVPYARPDSRSLMNITFKTPSEALDELFSKEAGAAGLDALKGHRATGGMRASTYNAMTIEGCRALADFMRDFERRHG